MTGWGFGLLGFVICAFTLAIGAVNLWLYWELKTHVDRMAVAADQIEKTAKELGFRVSR